MNSNRLLCILFFCSVTPLFGVAIVHGDSPAAPYAFTTIINAQAYDPATGMFFVGLDADLANPSYAISRATRPNYDQTMSFSPLLGSSSLSGQQIDLLTVAPQPNSAPFLIAVPQNAINLYALTADGSTTINSNNLNDAAGSATNDIISMTATPTKIFAAVAPNGGTFWQTNSGIAVTEILADNNNKLAGLQIKDATTGLDGNQAAIFDLTNSALSGSTADVTNQNESVSLYYDAPFNRLYIGVQIESGSTAGNVANSVVVANLDSSNILNFYPIVASSALTNNGDNGIVSVKSNGSSLSVTAFEPKVMHTSAGPDYLIVNGGPTALETVGNTVYALPLVNNPGNVTVHGTLANKNSTLTNGVFTEPATATTELAQTTDAAAMVGAGPLPTLENTHIADIKVYGDAVFVALSEIPSANTDTGLFSSQALFDGTGKIIQWTPWTRHLVPVNAFPNTTLPGGAIHDGPIKFFAVDEQTANIWIVEGTTDQTVGVTSWNQGSVKSDMVSTLNETVKNGCYSVLDLPNYTVGFTSTNYRYALFGGNDSVTFLMTSQKDSSQEITTTDFSAAGTVLTTSLPGTVRALEYSRRVTGSNSNYFFAGTQQGLFVFTDNAGNGFDVNALALLNAAPFSTRQWYAITSLKGEPLSIKTSGNGNLYVLTRTLTTNPEQPFTNTLYSIPFATTTTAMFIPGNIRTIAQTSVGIFADTAQFFDIALIATGPAGNSTTKEQLILATNQGLYYSNATQSTNNGITDALDQTAAGWILNETTATTAFNAIAQNNGPVQNTVWPLSIADGYGINAFDNGSLNQFSGAGNTEGTATVFNNGFIPLTFNAAHSQPPFSPLNLLEGFWNDGGRRLIIGHRPQNPSPITNVISVPFHPEFLRMMNPFTLTYPVINQVDHFYWLEQIGSTGQLLAGTDQGVIALS
jgi:hypothetical protein